MRSFFLLVCASLFLVGCLERPLPTPVEVQQYPATWTPAPTSTNTPLPPTATLVIQRTPGTLPTRDPNARILPNAPRNSLGVWLTLTSQTPKTLEASASRADVILTDGSTTLPRRPFAVLQLNADTLAATDALPPQYDGVLYENASAANADALSAKRTALAPRLVLASVVITDTGAIDVLTRNTDGLRLTNFLRADNASNAKFKGEAEWRADVESLAALSSNPNFVILTATRLREQVDDDDASEGQWLSYALASYLLGVNNSRTFFSFESASALPVIDLALKDVQLGSPLGALFKQNNVYQRRFTRGLALVNPSNQAYAFTLSRNYLDLNGTRLNQVNLPPHTGLILLNTE